MKKSEPTKEEYSQLRDLLIKYIEFKSEKYDWFPTDEVNWLVEESEKNDLDIPFEQLTCNKEEKEK